jgi:SAM-dependent methyltransferase
MENSTPAELYAKLHTGNPGDLDFYREQCLGAQSILELGCGYGRVIEALAEEGRQLVGLDLNRGLLALAARRLRPYPSARVVLVQGDMRRFAFERKFDRILIPYSALYCLLSGDEVRACFRRVAEHLSPGGRLIFDAYSADVFHRELPSDGASADGDEPESDEVTNIVHEGIAYQVVEQADWVRVLQRLDVVYAYEPRQGGHSIAAHIAHRYLLSDQVAPLLEAAGLQLETMAGDYAGSALDDDSDLMIVTALLA